MVASKAARERKAAAEAGDLATVKIGLDAQGGFAYTISCTSCTATKPRGEKSGDKRGDTRGDKDRRPWSTYRPGADNGYLAAMDRWTFHLHEQHSGTAAPCLAYLPEAQQRLHARRLEQERRQA